MGDSKRQLKGICFLCSAIRRIGFWSGYFRYSISLPLGLIKGVLCGSATDRAASAPATGTGSGTISEFDSGGCRPLSLNAKARARSGAELFNEFWPKGTGASKIRSRSLTRFPASELAAHRLENVALLLREWFSPAHHPVSGWLRGDGQTVSASSPRLWSVLDPPRFYPPLSTLRPGQKQGR